MEFLLLMARLYFGLGIAAHGVQKLFGWLGGYGVAGTGGWLESVGLRPGRLMALAAGFNETGGGLLLALGLLGPIGPALILVNMLVATLVVHARNGFFTDKNGVEFPMLYGMGSLAFAAWGPGELSADRLLGLDWIWDERYVLIAVGSAVALAVMRVLTRRPPRQPAPAAT